MIGESQRGIRVLSLSHTFPSAEKPWITPFIRSFSEAIGIQCSIECHVLVPTASGLTVTDARLHTVKISESNRIPHKRIGSDPRGVPLTDQLSYFARAARATFNLVRSLRIDLIHAHWAIPSGMVALAVSRLTGVPFVVTVHGRDVLLAPEYEYDTPARPHLRAVLKRVLRSSAAVVAASGTTSRAASAIAPDANLQVIPMGLDENWLRSPPSDGERSSIVSVGDLVPVKRIELAVEAVAASPTLREKEFLIVGDGPERARIERIVEHRELRNARFLGYRTHEEIAVILERALVFVYPSRVEGFGIAPLEALASGARVVGFPTGALGDLAGDPAFASRVSIVEEDGDTARLRSSMEREFDRERPIDRDSIVHALKERFGWASVGARYAELFRGIVRGQPWHSRRVSK